MDFEGIKYEGGAYTLQGGEEGLKARILACLLSQYPVFSLDSQRAEDIINETLLQYNEAQYYFHPLNEDNCLKQAELRLVFQMDENERVRPCLRGSQRQNFKNFIDLLAVKISKSINDKNIREKQVSINLLLEQEGLIKPPPLIRPYSICRWRNNIDFSFFIERLKEKQLIYPEQDENVLRYIFTYCYDKEQVVRDDFQPVVWLGNYLQLGFLAMKTVGEYSEEWYSLTASNFLYSDKKKKIEMKNFKSNAEQHIKNSASSFEKTPKGGVIMYVLGK